MGIQEFRRKASSPPWQFSVANSLPIVPRLSSTRRSLRKSHPLDQNISLNRLNEELKKSVSRMQAGERVRRRLVADEEVTPVAQVIDRALQIVLAADQV